MNKFTLSNQKLPKNQTIFIFLLFLTTLTYGQNNIGTLDDRCSTTNYTTLNGWGHYPVQAGKVTGGSTLDPRIERILDPKIYPGDKMTFEATFNIVKADVTTIAQILNSDNNSSDEYKPVVFIIAEDNGSNWLIRDQGFTIHTIAKNTSTYAPNFTLKMETYYNAKKTIAYTDVYINGRKKETKQHARIGQSSQMRYGNYHHGSGTSFIRVKNVSWEDTRSNRVAQNSTLQPLSDKEVQNGQFDFDTTDSNGLTAVIDERDAYTALPEQIQVYPNPVAKGELLTISSADKDKSIAVFDLQGKLIYSKEITGNQTATINTDKFNAGVYMIKVNSETVKFMVK